MIATIGKHIYPLEQKQGPSMRLVFLAQENALSDIWEDLRVFILVLFGIIGDYNYQMFKGQQIKVRKQAGREINVISPKGERNVERRFYETTSSNYMINVKSQKPRKCSDKIIYQRQKIAKPKKIKFITEEIEKSTQDLLSVGTKSHQKQSSANIYNHNAEQTNVYQLCRSTKKSKRLDEDKKSSKKNQMKPNGHLGQTKVSKRKSHSKDVNLKFITLKKRHQSTKKQNRASNSNRKSEKNLKKRQFLSPEIVKQQNSYYFSNADEQEEVKQNILMIPKKESKYIFESNKSLWNDQQKRILSSTLDLLN